jgi:hypothetical protein
MGEDARLFRLTLKPAPGPVPAVVRLRRLLKACLRGYGLRCVAVEEVTGSAGHLGKGGPREAKEHTHERDCEC